MNRRELLSGGINMAAAMAVSSSVVAPGGAALLTRKVPSSGEELPVIGLGTSGPFEVGESAAQRGPLAQVLAGFFAGGAPHRHLAHVLERRARAG